MALGVKAEIRNGWIDALITAINAGSGAGKIKIYDGTRPATGGTATNLLATLTFSDPAAGSASGGSVTLSSITEDADADASGTATWARITDSDDNFVCDCSVTATGGGGDITLNATGITAGGIVRITSGTLTAGNA